MVRRSPEYPLLAERTCYLEEISQVARELCHLSKKISEEENLEEQAVSYRSIRGWNGLTQLDFQRAISISLSPVDQLNSPPTLSKLLHDVFKPPSFFDAIIVLDDWEAVSGAKERYPMAKDEFGLIFQSNPVDHQMFVIGVPSNPERDLMVKTGTDLSELSPRVRFYRSFQNRPLDSIFIQVAAEGGRWLLDHMEQRLGYYDQPNYPLDFQGFLLRRRRSA